jgi:U4/U6.U5 tri-snRNP-associated protein 1
VTVASDTYTAAEMAVFKKPKQIKRKKIRQRAVDELDPSFAPLTDELATRDSSRSEQGAAAAAAAATERRENYEHAVQAAKAATLAGTRIDESDGDDEELLEALARQRQGALASQSQTVVRRRREDVLAEASACCTAVGRDGLLMGGCVVVAEAKQHEQRAQPHRPAGLVLSDATEFIRNLSEAAPAAAAAAPAPGANAEMADVQADEDGSDAELSESEMHKRIGAMIQEQGAGAGGWVDVDVEAERETPAADAEMADAGTEEQPAGADAAPTEKEEQLVNRGLGATLAYISRRGGFKELESMVGRVNEIKETRKILNDMDRMDTARTAAAASRGATRVRVERDPTDPIRIEYFDNLGRLMTPKEVFRMLSYKFHGMKVAKTKIDKNLKRWREQERTKAMAVGDTPLGTVKALERAQVKTGQAFIVLEGSGAKDAEQCVSRCCLLLSGADVENRFAQSKAAQAKRPASGPPPRTGGGPKRHK